MTREEALQILDTIPTIGEQVDALEMAIQALSQEPCETIHGSTYGGVSWGGIYKPQEPCDDAISRKSILKYIDDWWSDSRDDIEDLIIYITYLPSVTQKSGKWIEHPEIETSTPEYLMFYECSECGNKQCFCKSDIHKKRFCNHCGAKMESEVNNG